VLCKLAYVGIGDLFELEVFLGSPICKHGELLLVPALGWLGIVEVTE
jgi:hypothetical protein